MRYTILPARILFAAIFVSAGFSHFSPEVTAFAASQGVPLAKLAVPLSGVMALAGGLSIALGYRAKLGGLLVAAFLIPVTFSMHAFWTMSDPMMRGLHQAMFMKNLALLGGALAFVHFGAGTFSLDARRSERSPKLVSATA